MMWFKPQLETGYGTSYRLFDANTAAIYWLIGQGKTGGQADKFGFWFEDAADKDFQDWQTPSATLKQGQWNHIATTWDFDKGEAKFFIDGAEVSKTEGLGGFPPLAPKPKIGFNVGINYMPATTVPIPISMSSPFTLRLWMRRQLKQTWQNHSLLRRMINSLPHGRKSSPHGRVK